MAKNNDELAKQILDAMGGKENISSATHCVTRLRFQVKNKDLVKKETIDSVSGVMGSQWMGNQYQVIIGNEVDDVYKAVCSLGGFKEEAKIDENLDAPKEKKPFSIKNLFSTLLETISSILAPIIPAIVACGLLQGILYSLQSFGLIDSSGDTYTFFYNCSTAAFYFLPVLIGYSAAERFGCNKILGATSGAILILPAFSNMAGVTIKLFGFIPIEYASYSSTVIPAILIVYFQSYIEKFCKKHVPKMIDIIVTPLVTVMLAAIAGWALLAPIGGWIGTFVAEAILWLYETLGPIGGAICGAIYPFMLMTGMQVATTPIIAQNLATLGYDFLYPVLCAVSNSAMAAVALYICFKSKDEKNKSLGLSTGVTALIGVTEPVLFGLILKYKKALTATIIGGAVGGAIMALFKVKYLSFGFVPFGTIVLAMTDTFGYYMLGVIVSMVVAVIAMIVLKWKEEE